MTMRAIRDLWAEMVERRLWPVALVLAVALVAVPVVLAKQPAGGQAPAAAIDAPAVAPAAPAPGAPVVSVSAGGGGDAPMIGHWKDPFKAAPAPAGARPGTGTPAVGGKPTGAGTGSSGGGSGSSNGGGAKPAPRTYVYASVDVHFGRAGNPLKEIKDVPRLAPLPSASDPIVIFMGTRSDHVTAVFMLSTDVQAQGDGRCVPSTKTCEAIELRRGGVALLDVTDANGFVTQYELDLDDVALHTTTSQSQASAAIARASAWLTVDGPARGARTPEASAGAVASPPVLTPLP